MTRLADRQLEMTLRNRVIFGAGAVARLPELIAAAGCSRVFLVTDPGVLAAGIADRALAAPALPATVFSEVEPNPSGATVESGGDRKSTRLNSSHTIQSRMPSSA